MKKLTVAVSVLMTVAGCADPAPRWVKPGVTADEMRTQRSRCEYEVGMAKLGDSKEQDMIRSCMEKEGYRLRP